MVISLTDNAIGRWDIVDEVVLFRLDRSIVKVISRWLLT